MNLFQGNICPFLFPFFPFFLLADQQGGHGPLVPPLATSVHCMLLVSYIQQYFNTSITVPTNQDTDCTVQSAKYWCFYGTVLVIL